MAYDSTMQTDYSSGELVSLTDFETLTQNVDWLHDRYITQTLQANPNSGTLTAYGDFYALQVNNVGAGTNAVSFHWTVPDDFGTLVSFEILVGTTTSYTAEYDITTDYGNPDASEAYNNHSGSIVNTTLAFTANQPKWIDATANSALSSVAAGDNVGVKIINSTGANAGNWYPLLAKVVWTRSDSAT